MGYFYWINIEQFAYKKIFKIKQKRLTLVVKIVKYDGKQKILKIYLIVSSIRPQVRDNV